MKTADPEFMRAINRFHVMDAIRSLCDRVVVMSSGVKIADGSAAGVLADPEVVRAYLGTADAAVAHA